MGLQFILGKPGTGKTTLCLNEIGEMLTCSAPLYYLVPEQFSLQSEKLLLADRHAATQVQVLSFNRLAYRLFATFGGAPGNMADDLGKQMLLRKVLFDMLGNCSAVSPRLAVNTAAKPLCSVADNLTYYKSAADKHGFVEQLADTITEMNHYRVTAGDLQARVFSSVGANCVRPNEPPAFSAKMQDIALINERYRQTVDGRYLLTDDMLEILCVKLEELAGETVPLLDGAHFWVDGFSGFTPQERHVLQHLMKRAAQVKVTLTTAADSRLTPPQITREKLEKLAADSGVKVEPPVYMKENFRHKNSTGLAAFVDGFSMYKFTNGAYAHDGITITPAPNRYAAVYTAAAQISEWVTQHGYNFRDIAILCGDRNHYEKILQTTFDRLNIPLFVDTEIDILSHPLTELIRSALDIILRNWNYESVFRFLKTRMTGLDLDAVDVLENYTLAHGISSFRWRYPFTNPAAEAARQQLLAILDSFANGKTADTVQNHCRRVFDLLYAINAPATLQNWYDEHTAMGDHATAKLHKQIWPKICEIFDKLVEMLGEEKVTLKTFAATLDAGFKQVGLGRVPPTTNQVVLGDIGRSRYPQIKAMIVLGANENVLPAPPSPSGLFTDRERQALQNSGIELAADTMHRITESFYSLYCALSQPSDKLMLIYSEAEPSGKPLRPSPIITRLQEMFPYLPLTAAPKVSEYGEAELPPAASSTLAPGSVALLYGDTITTAASRLESFARCPFAYFMTYLLKAKPRQHFQVMASDVGTLFHDVLAQFAKRVWQGESSADLTLSRDDIGNFVDEIIQNLPATEVYEQTARNCHVLDKVRRASIASIWALCEHIKQGEFVPMYAEHEIRTHSGIPLENGKTLTLTGIIDRVDILQYAGEEFVKIIDYKSGNTKFNMDEVRQGVQLQLMIYMNVLMELRGAKPAGMFYFPIGDPLLDTDHLLPDDMREGELLKKFKMSGVALADENTLAAMDKNLQPGSGSSVIPVAINKDGKMKKSATPTTLDLTNFTQLGQDVQDIIKDLGHRMTTGDIAAEPYTKGLKSPCKFCNFGAVCGKI